MNVLYTRTSTTHQNVEQQTEFMMKHYEIEKVFEEQESAKNIEERPVLREMLDFVRSGDKIYCLDFSRISRSLRDLRDIIEFLDKKGVVLVSHKENFDTSTATGKLMISVIGAINEFQRELMLEKQAIGIQRAKAEGKYKGRAKKVVNDEDFEREYERYKNREINKGQLAVELGVSRPLLDRMLKDRGYM